MHTATHYNGRFFASGSHARLRRLAGRAVGLVIAPALAHAACAQDAPAQDPPVVTAEAAEMEMLEGPQNLPGQDKGDRARPEEKPEAEAPVDEKPDWFGGKAWWEWSKASGNWGALRTSLEDAGLSVAGSFMFDYQSAWSGGRSGRAVYDQLIDVNATIDIEKMFKLPGASVFIDFMSFAGDKPSAFIGDFQGTSNIEAPRHLDQIEELWWQQWLFDKHLRIKVGKVDANREFGFIGSEGEFANSGAALDTTNIGIPWFPDPSMGVNVFVYPVDNWYIGFGFYDGAFQDGVHTGSRGPSTFFSDSRSDDFYYMGETGYTFDKLCCCQGARVAAGGWYHDGDFAKFDGGTQSGTFGVYALFEATLWKRDPENADDCRGLACFCRYGYGEGDVNPAEDNVAGGFKLTGTFETRDTDSAGVYVSYSDLSDEKAAGFARDETVVDVYYRLNVTPWAHVQPELQFVFDPGGTGAVSDAVVGGLRVSIDF